MVKFFGSKNFLLAFLSVFAPLLALYPQFLSISGAEANVFYYDNGYLGTLARISVSIFGQNDFALRAPFFIFYFASLPLFYAFSKGVLKQESDARIALIVFCLLPASFLSALLVIKSSIVIFGALLFAYLHSKGQKIVSILFLAAFCAVDKAFAILFLSLIFYGIDKKDNALIAASVALFGVSMGIFGFDDGGRPKGYFLDTLGVYMLIFSPLLFLYFVFAMIKGAKGDRGIGWHISFWALLFSLLLSFRQKIMLYDFAPFVVLALPIMLKSFFSSYRVRIGRNKRVYAAGFAAVLSSLIAFFVASYANRLFYMFPNYKENHFAYKYQAAKELAGELKKIGVSSCVSDNDELMLRLKFYGIERGGSWILSEKPQSGSKKVSIVYSKSVVKSYYVTKVNTI